MKKILSLALAIIMIAAMFAVIIVPTSADEAAPEVKYASLYSGTPADELDTSWYYDNQDATEYHITSADQLLSLSYLVGDEFVTFKGKTIYLDCDIVWNQGVFTMDANTFAPLYNGLPVDDTNPVNEWYPIGDRLIGYGTSGSENGQFFGNFDGQGHTISGLYVNDARAYAGFFAVFCGQELKNLNIVNSYLAGQMCNGSFAGFAINVKTYGDNKDVVGARYENLYSNAFVVSTGQNGTAMDTRSGGIFGMIRGSNNDHGEGKVRAVGTLWLMKNVWFDGTLAATKTTYYTGGFIGCPAMDEQTLTDKENGFHKLILEDCLMTAALYNCTEASTNMPTSSLRMGLIIGNFYNGTLVLKNVVAAPKDTNITEDYVDANGNKFLGLMKETITTETDPITGAVTETKTESIRLGKGIMGRWENKNTGDITMENVFCQPIGMFVENRWNAFINDDGTIPNGKFTYTNGSSTLESEYFLQGEAVFDDGLVMALVALASNTAFDFTTPSSPKLNGFDLTVDEINPEEIPGSGETEGTEPVVTEPTVTEPTVTEPEATEPEASEPEATQPTTKPAVTTANKPDEGKSCSGFTAIGAVLALVAVTGAAIVIKKK